MVVRMRHLSRPTACLPRRRRNRQARACPCARGGLGSGPTEEAGKNGGYPGEGCSLSDVGGTGTGVRDRPAGSARCHRNGCDCRIWVRRSLPANQLVRSASSSGPRLLQPGMRERCPPYSVAVLAPLVRLRSRDDPDLQRVGFTQHHGTVSVSNVRSHRGRRYFSHLVMKWTTPNGRHHKEVLNWRRDGQFWIWIANYSGT
jgi:hypothetical protein